MKVGLSNALGLLVGYLVLMAAFALGLQQWLGSLEDRLSADTARLLARDQASLVLERSLETLRYPDGDSRRRLRQRISDLTLLSETVTSMAVVDREGKVVESDGPVPPGVLGPATEVLGSPPQPRIAELGRRPFLRGGDYVVVLPLGEADQVFGYLRIALHSDRMSTLYQDARRRLLGLALLGLTGVGCLGAFLQVQLSRRAASITAVLEGGTGPGPRPGLVPRDEFARALHAASQVKGALADARRQSERRGQQVGALGHALRVGVVLLRRELEVDYVNERALELLGYASPKEFEGHWPALRPMVREALGLPPRADGSWSVLLRAPTSGLKVAAEMHRLDAPDYEEYLVLLSDPRALEALEADARLASQLEGLGRVYRTMAHELRAPLSAMLINLDLLRESLAQGRDAPKESAHRQRRYVDVLRDELNRLNSSLHGILTQTVPEAQAVEFDLGASLADLLTLLAPQGRRMGIEVEARLGTGTLPIRGYPDRLRQAFLNVAVNAIEAMPRGGRLTVVARREEGQAVVEIADTGPGIPKDALERIYEPDFSTKEGGSGIGLYVARALVELHGGRIRVESPSGGGTRVLTSLPLAPAQA